MTPPENLTSLSRDELLALLVALQRQRAELTARHAAFQAEIEQLRRGAQRQAAPFSQGTRVANPQRPGRKPGAGPCHDREAPLPEQITAPSVDVPVTLASCPAWGGPLAEARVDGASTTDIPAIPRPPVTQYRGAVCRWRGCGTQGRGQPPDVAPDQHGATAHRGGDRARAAAHGWHEGSGIPVRQGPLVLEALPGLPLTQGAITQEALRRATGEVGTASARWREAGPERPVVPPDDTGGRVGGAPASRMACATDEATVSPIRSQPRHEEVQEGMPPDDAGVMGTARGRSDDAQACDAVDQPKYVAPRLRALRDGLQTKPGRSRDGGARRTGLWQDAMPRWHAWHAGEVTDVVTEGHAVWDAIPPPLRPRLRTDPDHPRRLNGIGRQHDRGHLRRFVADPQVEPTHHRAERVLRPAVIARKGAQCSKNQAGAQAFAAFQSVVQTLANQGVGSMVEGRYHLFRATRLHATSP